MKDILGQLKKESESILSDIGLKAKSGSVIGLDLGTDSFRAARIRHGIKEIPLKDTLIKEKAALKDLVTQLNIGDDERIAINFSPEALIIKRVSMHSMPVEEIKEALKWELKEQINADIDTSEIKFSIIGEKESQDGSKKIDVIAVVYNEKDAETKVKELKALGLNVQSIIPTEFALTSYINSQNIVSLDETAAIVDIGSTSTRISIVEKRKLSFTRDVAIGGDTITNAMTGTLLSDKGKIELSKEEAEKIKREQGVSDDLRILSMMRPVLERLVTQIKRSFEYCEHQFGAEPIKKIILAGGGARLKGLKQYLSKETEIEILDPLPEIAEAVGLGLMRDDGINMLPGRFKEEKGRELKKISLRMISISLGLIFLFSYGILAARSVNLKKELEIYNQHLETVGEIRTIKDKMVILGSAVATISSSTIETGKTMRELSNLMVSSAVLDSLLIKDTEPHMEFSGVVLKGEELSEFMSKLEASPMFEKVKLVFSEKDEDLPKGALDFEIRCNLE